MTSKIAIVGDQHFGIKKSNDLFMKSSINFFRNEMIPYLKKNKIERIIFMGDLFDNRMNVNVKLQNAVFDLFENDLSQFNILMIIGNHDCYLNSSIQINSLSWLRKFDNITVIDHIQELELFGDTSALFVPWLTNNKILEKYLQENKVESKICFGHFNIYGFYMNKMKTSESGLNQNLFFKNFKLTFSGHFHIRHTRKKYSSQIIYPGAPYHLTRHDIGEEKGFCILDLENFNYEFINNKNSIRFVSFNYPTKVTKKQINGNVVDIYVKYDNKYDEDGLLNYVRSIEKMEPAFSPNIKVINTALSDVHLENYKIKSSMELMKEYLNNLQDPEVKPRDKDKIYKILGDLYEECRIEI